MSLLRRTVGQCNVCSHGFPLLRGSAASPASMSCQKRLDSSSEFTQETAQQTAARLALEQVKARSCGRIMSNIGAMATCPGHVGLGHRASASIQEAVATP